MKKFYASVILVAALGFFFGYLILPKRSEVALMFMKDGDYFKAIDLYEKQWSEGDNSIDTVIPLSDLYFRIGDIDKAIIILQSYVKKNPGEVDALKMLANFYKWSMRTNEYMLTLEKITALENNKELKKELEHLYRASGEYEKLAALVEPRLFKKAADREDLDDARWLVSYHASQKRFEKAVELIEKMDKGKRTYLRGENIILALHVLLDAKKKERAVQLANDYLMDKSDVNDIRNAASVFIMRGEPELAFKLLNNFKKEAENDPSLMKLLFDSRIAMNQQKEVMAELKKRFKEGSLPEPLAALLTDLALEYGDFKLVKEVVMANNIHDFSYTAKTAIALYALIDAQPELAAKLESECGKALLEGEPILRLMIDTAKAGRNLDYVEKVLKTSSHYDIEDVFELAHILYENKYPEECFKLVKDLPPADLMGEFDFPALITMITEYGQLDYYQKKFRNAMASSPPKLVPIFRKALILISAGTGDPQELNAFLKKASADDTALCLEAYTIATNFDQYKNASEIALTLLKFDPDSPTYSRYLAQSLTGQGKFAEALAVLYAQKGKDEKSDNLYLMTLFYAKQAGFPVTEQYKKKAHLITDAILEKKTITQNERRSAAYGLSALGEKQRAEEIFLELFKEKVPDEGEIMDLVAICGKHPSAETLKWFTEHAAKAPEKSRRRWLNYLNELGQSAEVVKIVERNYQTVSLSFIDAYLQALILEGKAPEAYKIVKQYKTDELMKLEAGQRLGLLPILYNAELWDGARQIFESLPFPESSALLGPFQVASLYIKTDKREEGLKHLTHLKTFFPAAEQAWVLLSLDSGNEKAVSKWLASGSVQDTRMLQDLFYLAVDLKRYELAYQIASKLYDSGKNTANTLLLAQAHIYLNENSKALALVENLALDDKEATRLYILACGGVLAQGEVLSEKTKKILLSLSDKMLADKKSDVALKRDLGYVFSDAKMLSPAKKIFLDISTKEPYSSPDVQQLLYLCRESPDKKTIDWIKARALTPSQDEEADWLEALNSVNQSSFVLALLEKRYKKDIPLRVFDVYLDSLLRENRKEDFELALEEATKKYADKFSSIQQIKLANILYRGGYIERAGKLIRTMPGEIILKNFQPFPVVRSSLACGDAQIIRKRIKAVAAASSPEQETRLKTLFLFSCAFGEKKEIEAFLPELKNTDDQFLFTDAFTLASENKQEKTALFIAEYLYKTQPDTRHRILLAEALILNLEFKQAIEYIEPVLDKEKEAETTYFTALSGLVTKEGKKAVEPYMGKVDKLIADIEKRDAPDPDLMRQVGYFYTEAGSPEKAGEIFFKLAKDAPADSSDTEQLVYLMELHPAPKVEKWLVKRTKEAKGREQLTWLKYLNRLGKYKAVIKIMEKELGE